MKPAKNTPVIGPADWLEERQQQAQQTLAGFRHDCEELDRSFSAYEKEFESLISRTRTYWEDAVRLRSNEHGNRQLLDSIRDRFQIISAETEKKMEETEKLEERNNQIGRVLENIVNLKKLEK